MGNVEAAEKMQWPKGIWLLTGAFTIKLRPESADLESAVVITEKPPQALTCWHAGGSHISTQTTLRIR